MSIEGNVGVFPLGKSIALPRKSFVLRCERG
jgi:hypothetical protein